MEFRYSEIIDPSTYKTEGLCNGIPLRKHRDQMKEDIGAVRAQEDWTRLVSRVEYYKGGLGAEYTFISVTVPECLPERLEILSYANEFAFLYDDVMEEVDMEKGSDDDRELLKVFCEDTKKSDLGHTNAGVKEMQSKILADMLAIDKRRAMTTMDAWATFVKLSSSRERTEPFASLEEYLPYRIIDAGEMLWFGTVTFGMALTIPEEELKLCMELARPGYAALSLANDLLSWPKERDDARRLGQPHVINAIYVIMGEHSISESEAQSHCRAKLQEVVAEFVRIVDETKQRLDLSLDLRTYIEAVSYSVSGNLVWSLNCPRYHPEARYNDRQLLMMERGLANSLEWCRNVSGPSGNAISGSSVAISVVNQ